jgi:hypothetical protein
VELRRLRYFVAVAEKENVSRAALKLLDNARALLQNADEAVMKARGCKHRA